MQKELAE
jgi:tricarboxylate carrier